MKGLEKLEVLYTICGQANGTVTMENSIEAPQKIRIPYDSAIPILGIHPKELKSGFQRDISNAMFTVAPFIIAKILK
jgi:hypothetical protein